MMALRWLHSLLGLQIFLTSVPGLVDPQLRQITDALDRAGWDALEPDGFDSDEDLDEGSDADEDEDQDDLNFVRPSPDTIRQSAQNLNCTVEELSDFFDSRERDLSARHANGSNVRNNDPTRPVARSNDPDRMRRSVRTSHNHQYASGGGGAGSFDPYNGMGPPQGPGFGGFPQGPGQGFPGMGGVDPSMAALLKQAIQLGRAQAQNPQAAFGPNPQPGFALPPQVGFGPNPQPTFAAVRPQPPQQLVPPAAAPQRQPVSVSRDQGFRDKPIQPIKFSGKVGDVTLFCYQGAQYTSAIQEQSPSITELALIKKLAMFLSGEAFAWWRDIDEAPGGPLAQGIVSTDIFFEKLKARFIQHNDSIKAKTTLQNLTQKPGQSAQQLAVTFRELARIVAVHMTPMDTTTQAEIFLKALHPRLRERVKLCTTVPGMLYDFELLVEQTVLVEQASPELLIAGPKTNEFTNSGDRDRRQGRDNRQKNEKSVVDVALASAPGYTYAHAMSGIKRSRFRPDQFQPPQNRRDPQQGFGHHPQAEFGIQPPG